VRLSDLLSTAVETETGRKLGRVHDVRARREGNSLKVKGLVVGPRGVLERLGLEPPRRRARLLAGDVIPWEAVIRADRRGIVVRDEPT
jgi:sporulation protein YlmC with PRC-barrel domain